MKKLIVLMIITTPVLAQDHLHIWTKTSQTVDQAGQTVCTWRCQGMFGPHYATTVGNPCHRP